MEIYKKFAFSDPFYGKRTCPAYKLGERETMEEAMALIEENIANFPRYKLVSKSIKERTGVITYEREGMYNIEIKYAIR